MSLALTAIGPNRREDRPPPASQEQSGHSATARRRNFVRRSTAPGLLLAILTITTLAVSVASIFLGRNEIGWHLASSVELARYLPSRWPRMIAAMSAGAMPGSAGVALQCLTNNPMAPPEILGISSRAVFGVICLFLFGGADPSAFATFVCRSTFLLCQQPIRRPFDFYWA